MSCWSAFILILPLKKQIYVVTAIDLNRTKVFLCVLYNFDRCILIFFSSKFIIRIGAKHCQTQYIRSSVPNQECPSWTPKEALRPHRARLHLRYIERATVEMLCVPVYLRTHYPGSRFWVGLYLGIYWKVLLETISARNWKDQGRQGERLNRNVVTLEGGLRQFPGGVQVCYMGEYNCQNTLLRAKFWTPNPPSKDPNSYADILIPNTSESYLEIGL